MLAHLHITGDHGVDPERISVKFQGFGANPDPKISTPHFDFQNKVTAAI